MRVAPNSLIKTGRPCGSTVEGVAVKARPRREAEFIEVFPLLDERVLASR